VAACIGRLLVVVAAALGLAGPAAGQLRGVEVRLDNDQFAFTRGDDERWYTSGGYFAFAFQPAARAPDARLAAAWCTYLIACDPGSRMLRVVSIGHTIHTPAATGGRTPQPYDRPYAATLHGGLATIVQGTRTRQTLELQLGVVGPAALGEEVQNTLHTLIGQARAQGWGYQVRAQPLVGLGWSRLSRHGPEGAGWDAVLRTSVMLGTPVTQAGLGALVRAGSPPAAPHWPGESGLAVAGGGAWQVHAGVEARAVAANALIDGDPYGYVSRVRREALVGDLLAGAAVAVAGGWALEFTLVLRAVEFSTPVETLPLRPQRFGMVALRWQAGR
jgi:lipid A 3-O-deacylase